jgi:hypothetical protein
MRQGELLERLRRSWQARWLVSALTAAGLTGWATGTLLMLGSWGRTPALIAGWTAALATLGVFWMVRPPITRSAIARHLNRIFEQAEESADLLIDAAETLAPLERLQRARVERHLASCGADRLGVPGRILRLPLVTAVFAGLLGGAAWLWPGGGGATMPVSESGHQLFAPTAAPVITDFSVTVTPPWSRLTWQLSVANLGSGAVRLQPIEGDSLAFEPTSAAGLEATLTMTAHHSMVYRVVARRGEAESTTGHARLLVRPDLPPTVTITTPRDRVSLALGDSWIVPLEALAGDDYGLEDPVIVATVASGYGEGVQFREETSAFRYVDRGDPRALRLRDQIDLAALGMAPGDELYVYVRARDNRRPVANESRTEVVIISIEDTATVVVSDIQGLAVDRMPDYFRSQRQIIIDTERLLAERAAMSEQAWHARSQHIGFDQHLLRLRYSELVGDEFEDTPLGMTEEDAAALGFESLMPEEPAPDDPPVREQGADEAAEDPIEDVRHDHDDPENATRLTQTVKTMLKASLDEMWQAELRLRTNRPAEALPYEERALDLLKRVQQAARSYVLRTGFEPAPLDPATVRLTGALDQVHSGSEQQENVGIIPNQELRGALMVVRDERIGLATGAGPSSSRLVLLEDGGRVLARKALEDPVRYLEPLGALRRLADSIEAGRPCSSCLDTAESGLLGALPQSVPVRSDSRRAARGTARRYFEELDDVR